MSQRAGLFADPLQEARRNGLHVSTNVFAGRLMIHIGSVFVPEPKRTMIVGFGAGESYKASLNYGFHTTVVELVPAVPKLFPLVHPEDHRRYREDPNSRVVINDGRNFLFGTPERFDLVLVDGSPPIFASGTVNLYTHEFASLVHGHLTERGTFALWIPTFIFEEDFWMIARSFSDVFSHVRIWAGEDYFGMLLLGTPAADDPYLLDASAIASRLNQRGVREIVSNDRIAQLIANNIYLSEEEIRAYAAKYPRLTDDRPRTEFPLLRFFAEKPFHSSNTFLRNASTSTRAR